MGFRDLEEFFSSELRLPIGGREYIVPSPDGETGLWVQHLMAIGEAAAKGKDVSAEQASRLQLDDEEERSLYERLLGEAMDDMVADGIDWEKIKLAGMTAMMWVGFGLDAAERYWNSGGSPEAETPPNRAARRGRTTTQAAGRSTRKQVSGTGTRSRQARPRTIPGELATPGGTSSGTGD